MWGSTLVVVSQRLQKHPLEIHVHFSSEQCRSGEREIMFEEEEGDLIFIPLAALV
jgi:hypothetical protein